MKTALITGLRSFTGRYLKTALQAAGYGVYGTVHGINACGKWETSLDLCSQVSVRKFVARVRPDVVIHLAAISFVAHDNVEEMYRTNILGTRNLLEAIVSCGHKPTAVLLVSSANIYGQTTVDPITESTPVNPLNDYGVSKLAMEHMAHLWIDKLPVIIVRPFNYTGVGQSLDFLLSKIVDHYRQKKPVIELGNLNVARDFSDVRMVVKAYIKLIELAPVNEIFNICSGQMYSLQQILVMMTELAGYEIQVNINPAYVRKNEIKSFRGSNAKLIKSIGNIEIIPLKETLRWIYESSSRN